MQKKSIEDTISVWARIQSIN